MNGPIGIFDSGVGGTSIWKELVQLLPNENTMYLADSKNAPYGIKSKKEILRLSIKNTEKLLEKGAKIIVVACNTATTNAITELRKNYPIPFIGIEPAIKPAALNTTTKRVGVLATKGTLSSSLFHNTSKMYAGGIQVFEKEGRGLVRLIEAGKQNDQETEQLLIQFLRPMLQEDIDCLVLGCTHYPHLIPILKRILPPKVRIIDSGYAVAKQTKAVLEFNDLLNHTVNRVQHVFFTNKDPGLFGNFIPEATGKVRYLDF